MAASISGWPPLSSATKAAVEIAGLPVQTSNNTP